MREPHARTDRRLADCLGAAALAALAACLVEAAVATTLPNALVRAAPPLERARWLALTVLAFPALALPAGLVGTTVARTRPRLGRALAGALPPLVLAVESLRVASPAGGAATVLGVTAAVLALAAAALFSLRRPPLRGRAVGGGLAAGVALFAGLMSLGREAAHPVEATASPAPPPARWEAEARNVLIVLVDTLRADHLGCYGYARDTSPRIDAFARAGTLFENAVTPKPKTSPAVASLLTGTWPSTHRVHAARTELPEECVTLAETLQAAGFATFGVSANTNINKTLGFGQGFDELRWITRVTLENGETVDNHAEQLVQQAEQWLAEHGEERFLAYVHLIDPHSPYRAPAPHAEVFLGDGLDPGLGTAPQDEPSESYVERIHRTVFLPEAGYDLDAYVARYDAEIRFTDGAVGSLLDALERLDLAESTVVVFLSDHGESIVEHGAWFNHGLFPYEEQIHVPLVLRGPGIAAGARRDEVVSIAGVMATLLELLGVPRPPEVEVGSFAALLRPDAPATEGGEVQLSAREESSGTTWGLRTDRWKYLHNPGRPALADALRPLGLLWPGRRLALSIAPLRDSGLADELYDLRADPDELVNLAYREPETAARLRARMEAVRAASRPVAEAPRILGTQDFTEEARRDLARLGYLGK